MYEAECLTYLTDQVFTTAGPGWSNGQEDQGEKDSGKTQGIQEEDRGEPDIVDDGSCEGGPKNSCSVKYRRL
ncbi:MAG TPA: hypothetical protein VHZ55_02005 [Bryobacteraceae bacterium]|jgi:hypothetical protein|nr:hypothetical protein [Bryobacteraceae bacterium]